MCGTKLYRKVPVLHGVSPQQYEVREYRLIIADKETACVVDMENKLHFLETSELFETAEQAKAGERDSSKKGS